MNRYRPYRSSLRSRAIGNQKAANQQKDISQVVLKTTLTRAAGQGLFLFDDFDPDNRNNWLDTGTIALNIYDVLLRCEFYENYSTMYDQVRIDGVKVTITPCIWTTSRNESPMPGYTIPNTLTVVTAWDRSGLSHNQFVNSLEEPDVAYCTVGDDIETYSSAVTKKIGSGGMFNTSRFLYPQSYLEKNQFVNCKDLKKQYTQIIDEPYQFVLEKDAKDDSKLPNNPREDAGIPFKPTFLLSVRSPYKNTIGPNLSWYGGSNTTSIAWNKLRPTVFSLEFEVTVTFRGLRYDKQIN